MLRAPSWRLALALLAVLGVACSDCNKTPVNGKDRCVGQAGSQSDHRDPCVDTAECGDHYACKDVKDQEGLKCCLFVDRKCATEADCCPGQTCPEARKVCADKVRTCTRDADCRADEVCDTYIDNYGTSQRCRHRPCGPIGECPDGQSCFQKECLASLPCDGTCEAGKGCVPSADRCQDYRSPTGRESAACPMTCNAGYLATFVDNTNIWDSCRLADVKCVCAELPPLRSNDLGRFSAIAADPGRGVYVSMYDGQFGDLAVARYGLDGKQQALEYVDGVPTGGTAKYAASGPRGGVLEPGDDVGRYTDVAVKSGVVYVSYYDVTNDDLKVAIRSADGTWTKHTVDGANADLGLYTSIAVDSDGNPGVAYFQRAGKAGFNATDCPAPAPSVAVKYITALKFARATSARPASASDWQIRTVACLARPPPACDGCMAPNVCADTGDGPLCLPPATGCTMCDMNTESCVTSGGTAKCGKKYNPSQLLDVPVGVGVFASLDFSGKDAVIAYLRRVPPPPNADAGTAMPAPEGDLYAVTVSANNAPGAPVLLDGSGDTGYFPDLKVEPATRNIAVGYHDFTTKSFKFLMTAQLAPGITPEVIDRGVDAARPGQQSFVGTDSAIIFGPSAGQVWAVYQDSTQGDLKLARRSPTWTVQPSLATQGAVGFFADGVFTDGKIYASHARLHAALAAGEPRTDNQPQLSTASGN